MYRKILLNSSLTDVLLVKRCSPWLPFLSFLPPTPPLAFPGELYDSVWSVQLLNRATHRMCTHTDGWGLHQSWEGLYLENLRTTGLLVEKHQNSCTKNQAAIQMYSVAFFFFLGIHSKKLSFPWEWGAYSTTEILSLASLCSSNFFEDSIFQACWCLPCLDIWVAHVWTSHFEALCPQCSVLWQFMPVLCS